MNLRHLGEQIDIHGGGNDLVFPHHENEIAQTESLTDKTFARYWMHNGMLQLSGEKMSKSLGNLVTIQEFLSQHEGNILRLMVLNSNYRSPLTFNDEVIAQTERALERLRSALRPATSPTDEASTDIKAELQEQVETTRQGFLAAMDDDFNTAGAMGHLFELVRTINQVRDAGTDEVGLKEAKDLLIELSDVLGLRLARATEESGQASEFVELLIEVRRELREQKLWALSDLIRDRLVDLGVILEDSKESTTWRWQ
jgi:cysteinyl-tRNA synthetase